MNRWWSLLASPTGGARRARGLLVLALAVLTPVVVLLTLVPQRADDAVPAALVNLDVPIQSGSTPVAAGKLLTENVVGARDGVAWTLTDPQTAQQGLDSGAFLAVATIPSDFSKDAATLGSATPVAASISVQTSTAHGYLVGTIAQALTAHLPDGVSAQLTGQYVDATLGAFGQLRTGIGQAAGAAGQIADGTGQAAAGAAELSRGAGQLAGGVREISRILAVLPDGARDLGRLSALGAEDAARLAERLAERAVGAEAATLLQDGTTLTLDELAAWIRSHPQAPASEVLARVEAAQLTARGVSDVLRGQAEGLGRDALDAGVLALGTGAVAAVSGPVADGLGDLAAATGQAAGGADQLAAGDAQLDDGLGQLSSGSSQLAAALSQATAGIPDYSDAQRSAISTVVSAPVSVDHVAGPGPTGAWASALAAIAPLGAWLGAFVTFLVIAPFSRAALTSPASSLRIARDGGRVAAAVGAAQGIAVGLTVALLGAAPDRLVVTFAFAVAMGLCFAVVHQALVAAFGRGGLIVSAVALGVQLVAAGTLVPAALSPAAGSVLSLLPLSLGLQGAQALVGGSLHALLSAAVGLVVWGLLAAVAVVVAVGARRRRLVRALAIA